MRTAAVLAGVAVFAAAMWFAFLGWDQEYYVVDGAAQGPYRAWQVIGCGGAITLAATAAYLSVRRLSMLAAIPLCAVLGFAVPWSAQASQDGSGLWVVGLFLLVVGGTVGLVAWLALVHAVAEAVRPARARRAG